ncbi:MAG: hypothetical protein AAF483_27525 [Planctomycetota bacterium]
MRSILLLTLVVALILGFIRELNRRLNDVIMNPYRLQAAGDLLIDYMESRNCWPTNWADLKQFTETPGHGLQGVREFHEIEQNVRVDFSFDPMSFSTAPNSLDEDSHLTVVVANNGTTHGATRDPNTAIRDYLIGKLKAAD